MFDDFDPQTFLEQVGAQEDQDIDLAKASLAMALVQHEGVSVSRYLTHLEKLVEDVRDAYQRALETQDDSAETRLSVLIHVLSDEYGYTGDVQTYDDLQNASLVRVIDRAKGLPITLSILYIHVGRAMGWAVEGLNVPGHFVCRIEFEGRRIVFDPFEDGKVLEAPELRGLVKRVLGRHAELSAEYFEPAKNREILIRLQNNIKFRKIDVEDYSGALEAVKLMRKVDPQEWRLLLDAGVLYARTEQPKAAIKHLSAYIDQAPDSRDRYEAELLLSELSGQLN